MSLIVLFAAAAVLTLLAGATLAVLLVIKLPNVQRRFTVSLFAAGVVCAFVGTLAWGADDLGLLVWCTAGLLANCLVGALVGLLVEAVVTRESKVIRMITTTILCVLIAGFTWIGRDVIAARLIRTVCMFLIRPLAWARFFGLPSVAWAWLAEIVVMVLAGVATLALIRQLQQHCAHGEGANLRLLLRGLLSPR